MVMSRVHPLILIAAMSAGELVRIRRCDGVWTVGRWAPLDVLDVWDEELGRFTDLSGDMAQGWLPLQPEYE